MRRVSLVERTVKVLIDIVKEDRRRAHTIGQARAVVLKLPTTVEQTVADSLPDGNGACRAIQVERPRRLVGGLRCLIDEQCEAVFALYAIRMHRKFCTTLIRAHIYIRWHDAYSGNCHDDACDLAVKKSSDAFVVCDVAAGASSVAERHTARAQ